MNFLSHFYFERKINDSHRTLGAVLPDLLRNMDRDIRLFPEKNPDLFQTNPKTQKILAGWVRHLVTDKLFHNNLFFQEKTRQLKAYISPVLINTPIRPSFLSHIALELLLDRLLIQNNWLHEDDFYDQLREVDTESLALFLQIAGLPDPNPFIVYFNGFIKEKYLGSYRDMNQVTFALNQICKKFWPQGLNEEKKVQLALALSSYELELALNYKVIFNEIADYLNKNGY